MAYNKQYKDFLEISPNFESVVDIDADKRNQNLWREYIVGDDMENLVDVLCIKANWVPRGSSQILLTGQAD